MANSFADPVPSAAGIPPPTRRVSAATAAEGRAAAHRPAAVLQLDRHGNVLAWDAAAEALLGWRAETVIGRPLDRLLSPPAPEAGWLAAALVQATDRGQLGSELPWRRADGRETRVDSLLLPLRLPDHEGMQGAVGGFLAVLRDAEAPRRAEATLRRALRRKDLLIQEVHHRVKNSLQLAQDLLMLQAHGQSPTVAALLADGAARVRSIAAVHERLYRTGAADEVELGDYLRLLVTDLQRALCEGEVGRSLQLTVHGRAMWPSGEVPPLGLITTELVTNALKHGGGQVDITLALARNGAALLTVEDGGQEARDEVPDLGSPGIGMQMVRALLEGRGTLIAERRLPQGMRFQATLQRGPTA